MQDKWKTADDQKRHAFVLQQRVKTLEEEVGKQKERADSAERELAETKSEKERKTEKKRVPRNRTRTHLHVAH